MSSSLQGAVIAITGGTGGLGAAVVRRLHDAGAACHVTWRSEREVERFPLAQAVTLHQVELTDEQAVTDFYAGLHGLWASVHLAGGFAMASALNTSKDQFTSMLDVNATTSFLCSREALRQIRAQGRQTTADDATQSSAGYAGRVVNVAARPAVAPAKNLGAYAASKAAVAALTGTMAAENSKHGINVNAVAPSIIDTPANREAMPDAEFGNWPKPEEVAEAIAFLVGPESTLSSGTVLPVYGRA